MSEITCKSCGTKYFPHPKKNKYGKCPKCGLIPYYYELHPLGTEPIDFSEMNMDDPLVLRMYFGK